MEDKEILRVKVPWGTEERRKEIKNLVESVLGRKIDCSFARVIQSGDEYEEYDAVVLIKERDKKYIEKIKSKLANKYPNKNFFVNTIE